MNSYNPNNIGNFFRGHVHNFFNLKNNTILFFVMFLVGFGWIFFTGLYTVAVDEVAVIQRFGKYNRQATPGLHFKWPDGIEKRTNVSVQKIHTAEFGQRTIRPGVETKYAPEDNYLNESLMLTGDLNCAVVPWIVQFRISDPVSYLFQVRNQGNTMRDLSEAVMRQVVGDRSINEVISKRLEIADKVKIDLQNVLDATKTGITVVNVELKNTNVPGPVQASFNEVNQARQEKERMIYEAKKDYNKVIPAAKGEADKMVSEAEGYALDRINRALGDSSRFAQLYDSYRKDKDIMKRRLYLETMQKIYPKLGKKYVVDKNQSNVLPLMNLGTNGGVK